jgi:hypothetical protein
VIVEATVPVIGGQFSAELAWDADAIKSGDWIKVRADDGDIAGTREPTVDAVGSVWVH